MLRAKLKGNIGDTVDADRLDGRHAGPPRGRAPRSDAQSFATITAGELCGDVTAGSLAAVAAPVELLNLCGFGATNTLLDVFVAGCNIFGTQIAVTQPDSARVVGDSYTFTLGSGKHVTGCKKNGETANLSDCLNDAAYSAFFRFTSDRVIAK